MKPMLPIPESNLISLVKTEQHVMCELRHGSEPGTDKALALYGKG